MHRHFVGIFRAAIESFSGFKVFIDKSNRRKQTDGRTDSRERRERRLFVHFRGQIPFYTRRVATLH